MIETWGNRQCSAAAAVLRERRRHQWESIGDDCEAINHLGVVGSHRCVHPYQTKMRRREKRIHFLHSHAFQLGTPHDDLILFFFTKSLNRMWYNNTHLWEQTVLGAVSMSRSWQSHSRRESSGGGCTIKRAIIGSGTFWTSIVKSRLSVSSSIHNI